MPYISPKEVVHLEIQNQYLTKRECSQLLKVSQSTIDKYRREGFLKAYKIGATVLFKRAEVEAAIIQL
ncbi:helix-turn-helix domain-containing protein [Flagellimonas flava]|uniref:Transcriptional regulator, AlpA family n=1 Tax=Flagellimonas flava TaxID=570519 RepID=A0A1M5N7A4_9FLAO|nr:helix-turn-helix domain-containing protein [Allomuricauda flava]SHG85486.1 transcriptional regulator, AlpA family [Allomuricauda flava]